MQRSAVRLGRGESPQGAFDGVGRLQDGLARRHRVDGEAENGVLALPERGGL